MVESEGQETVETVDNSVLEGGDGFLENDPLSDIYPKPEEETVIDEEAVTATETDETGDDEEVTPAKVETEPLSKEEEGFKAAYLAEKEKRQALEKEKEQKPPKKEEFDWQDPNKTIDNIKNDINSQVEDRFIKMSIYHLGKREPDAKEKLEVFDSMARENPSLFDQMVKHPDPGQYAYDLAAQKMLTDEVGSDPKAYEEKIRADERAKVEAELKATTDKNKKIAESLPPSTMSFSDRVPTNKAPNEPFSELFPGQVAS